MAASQKVALHVLIQLLSLLVDIIKAELEEKQFKVKLTVIDTPGFGDYVNNRDSWMPIIDFIVRAPFACSPHDLQ